MFIDFHSHFLSGVDDGAENVETGAKMLSEAFAQGVERIVATPHYFIDGNLSIIDAVKKRDDSIGLLKKYISKNNVDIPEIIPGFEVAFSEKLISDSNLKLLCIGDTDYILIEMPYTKWDDDIVEQMYKLSISGVKPILAHVDRYYRLMGDSIFELLELDLTFQLNCNAMDTRYDRNFVKQLFKAGRHCIIGSDMHNLTDRRCNIESAFSIAEKKFPKQAKNLFYNNADRLLKSGR